MNHKAYSKAYNQDKQALKDAIKKFKLENPERFAELQERALHELEHPPERPIVRSYRGRPTDVGIVITQFRAGRKHFYVYTTDRWNDVHLYSELLLSPEQALEVMTQRHPKFTEREERITKTEPCVCPLCQ